MFYWEMTEESNIETTFNSVNSIVPCSLTLTRDRSFSIRSLIRKSVGRMSGLLTTVRDSLESSPRKDPTQKPSDTWDPIVNLRSVYSDTSSPGSILSGSRSGCL